MLTNLFIIGLVAFLKLHQSLSCEEDKWFNCKAALLVFYGFGIPQKKRSQKILFLGHDTLHECVSKELVCDGKRDCQNGSDELNCNCKGVGTHLFQCKNGKDPPYTVSKNVTF